MENKWEKPRDSLFTHKGSCELVINFNIEASQLDRNLVLDVGRWMNTRVFTHRAIILKTQIRNATKHLHSK
jgi:hypothetical protein